MSSSKEKMSISSKKKWRRGSLEMPNVEQLDSETDFNKFNLVLKRGDFNLRSYMQTADGHFVSLGLPTKFQQVSCAYYDAQLKLKTLVCKSTPLFLVLNQVIVDFPHLFSLNLDYCNLTCDHINLLKDTLKLTKTVKELSLVGNPIRNFHHLISCGLKVLSLKLCNVDQDSLERIALEYANLGVRREAATLIHLDLSLNPVFDAGCRHLAAILRCDRQLRSLNLTDCKITKQGVEMLASCFLPFTLNQEELAVRRRIRFDYYRLQQQLSDGSCDSLPPDDATNSLKAKLSVSEIRLRQHPFTNQDSVQQDGEVWCKGNYSLETLNLSCYNHLSQSSLEVLLKVVRTENGLKRLVLEGCAPELKNAIQDYLSDKELKKKSSTSNGSATSTVSEKSSSVKSRVVT